MRERKVLITGGAGFIGSELVRQLLGDGATVTVYDNLSFGDLANLPSHPKLIFRRGDITESTHMQEVVRECAPDMVFHLAAIHFIPYCVAHPQETIRTNVEGTAAVLQACRSTSVKSVVCASTAAVYAVQGCPHGEEDPTEPIEVYGVSKLCMEQVVKLFQRETGIRSAVCRLFNAYGPRETNPHLIPEIVRQLAHGNRVELGNLTPKRDYIHTSDMCRALRAVACSDSFQMETFNIATGRAYSAAELVTVCGELLGSPIEVVSTESRRRATERPMLLGSIEKIQRLTGWKPEVDIRSGLSALLRDISRVAKHADTTGD